MAGPSSNFDAEIKKGMQPKAAKSSNEAAPGKAPAKGGNFNTKPKASPAQPQDQSADTHSAMIQAGQAHMDAIHAHITKLAGGGGGYNG